MVRIGYCLLAVLIVFSTDFAFASSTKIKQGTRSNQGSPFTYVVFADSADGKKRHIEARHLRESYAGPLARLSFRDRHLQVFKMVAILIKENCPKGVAALGNINISKDPERDYDPLGQHPSYFIWQYTCK